MSAKTRKTRDASSLEEYFTSPYSVYGLKGDPFLNNRITSYRDFKTYPFITTEAHRDILQYLSTDLGAGSSNAYAIIGQIGAGKTTTLLWLHENLSMMNKVESIFMDAVFQSRRECFSYITRELGKRGAPPTVHGVEDKISYLLSQGRRLYFTIDVPDWVSRDRLRVLAELIEILLKLDVSMILSFSISQRNKFQGVTTVLGKFFRINLKPFNLEETKELVFRRLEMFREKSRDDFYPFTEEAIEMVYRAARGNPRNTITACRTLLSKAYREKKELIDTGFVADKLGVDYFYRIVEEREEDPGDRAAYKTLIQVILEVFDGRVPSQQEIIKYMKENLNWGAYYTRRRLKRLVQWGILSEQRDEVERWRKTYVLFLQ